MDRRDPALFPPSPDDHLFPVPECVRRQTPKKKEPSRLPPSIMNWVHAMVYGVSQPMFTDGGASLQPGSPLSSKQAAFALGIDPRKTEQWMKTRIFKDTLRGMVSERRFAEEPANLATAIAIRDCVGGDTPDDRRVRLQAIGVIRPKEPGQAVNINLQQNTNISNDVSPGYVVLVAEKGIADEKKT